MKNYFRFITAVGFVVLFGGTIAKAQIATGGTFRLEQSVIASGGGTSSGGNLYTVESTVGEAVAGTTSSGGNFSVKGGFLSADPLGPSAATVSVGGRVTTPTGGGLLNALVTLTDSSGAARTVTTRRSGDFRFDDVNAGETYVISVNSKRYRFLPQVLSISENTLELVFVAQ